MEAPAAPAAHTLPLLEAPEKALEAIASALPCRGGLRAAGRRCRELANGAVTHLKARCVIPSISECLD